MQPTRRTSLSSLHPLPRQRALAVRAKERLTCVALVDRQLTYWNLYYLCRETGEEGTANKGRRWEAVDEKIGGHSSCRSGGGSQAGLPGR